MKPEPANAPGDRSTEAAGANETDTTGLPRLRTWRAVYAVVLGIFLSWVALLTWLTVHYS